MASTETRVALIGILVSDPEAAMQINALLHNYGNFIVGRMGLPYAQAGLSIISVVLDAPQDAISALSGKLGAIPGVSTKTIMPKPDRGELLCKP